MKKKNYYESFKEQERTGIRKDVTCSKCSSTWSALRPAEPYICKNCKKED